MTRQILSEVGKEQVHSAENACPVVLQSTFQFRNSCFLERLKGCQLSSSSLDMLKLAFSVGYGVNF